MTKNNLDQVRADYRQDQLPAITIGLYEAFMSRGEQGHDALLAYMHLLYTYRRQSTNQVWATQAYLMKGLSMGRNKVTAARALLKGMELAESVEVRDPATKRITGHYIKLNLLPNPGKATAPESGSVEKSPEKATAPDFHRVAPERQMLEEETKMLEEETAAPIAKPQAPPSEPSPRKQKDGRSEKSPKVSRPPAPDVRPDFETKQWIGVTAELFEHWEWCYPAVDIELEMRSALDFAYSHPEKQYTKWLAYLTGWFRRTQQRKGAA